MNCFSSPTWEDGGEPGRLAAFPPGHANDPPVCIEGRAVELVPHRLELRPAAAVLLVGQRKALRQALGALAERPFERPLLDRFFIELVGPNRGAGHLSADQDGGSGKNCASRNQIEKNSWGRFHGELDEGVRGDVHGSTVTYSPRNCVTTEVPSESLWHTP